MRLHEIARKIISRKTALKYAVQWRGPDGGPIDRFIESGGVVIDEEHRTEIVNAITDCMHMASKAWFPRLLEFSRYINNVQVGE